jgi:SpoVK/Ycf46/Vps4 family AAA+-type ATPase
MQFLSKFFSTFIGNPGCGKTLVAAAVATELDATFYSIDAASIMSNG